jgi:hypothetical protein
MLPPLMFWRSTLEVDAGDQVACEFFYDRQYGPRR